MNFERGQDPKTAMNIGIRKKIFEAAEKIVEENMFNLANATIRRETERAFKEHTGFPVHIDINIDTAEVSFYVKIPCKVIQQKIKIEKTR
jgi:hypothetical protein